MRGISKWQLKISIRKIEILKSLEMHLNWEKNKKNVKLNYESVKKQNTLYLNVRRLLIQAMPSWRICWRKLYLSKKRETIVDKLFIFIHPDLGQVS